MITPESVRILALAFEETIELPHFELTSFRVRKKIFATMDVKNQKAVLMLSPVDQSVFSDYAPAVIYPVPNSWGQKGATVFELKKVRKDIFKDALTSAYCLKAPQALGDKYRTM